MGVRHLQRDANAAGDGDGNSRNLSAGDKHSFGLKQASAHSGVQSFSSSSLRGKPGPKPFGPGQTRAGGGSGSAVRGTKNITPFRMGKTSAN